MINLLYFEKRNFFTTEKQAKRISKIIHYLKRDRLSELKLMDGVSCIYSKKYSVYSKGYVCSMRNTTRSLDKMCFLGLMLKVKKKWTLTELGKKLIMT